MKIIIIAIFGVLASAAIGFAASFIFEGVEAGTIMATGSLVTAVVVIAYAAMSKSNKNKKNEKQSRIKLPLSKHQPQSRRADNI